MEQQDKRTIRWFGNYQFSASQKRAKYVRVYVNVLRRAQSEDLSAKTNPDEGFYGYVTLLDGKYLVAEKQQLDHVNQRVLNWWNEAAYLHQSVSCQLEAVLTSFVNLFTALNLNPIIQRNNPIKDWKNRELEVDMVAVKLLKEDMIAEIVVEWDGQEVCEVPLSEPPEYDPSDPPPPPPTRPNPTPDNQFDPPNQAYDGQTDEGFTYKPEDDEPGDFPYGNDCQPVRVTGNLAWRDADGVPNNFNFNQQYWGPVTSATLLQATDPDDPQVGVLISSRGRADDGGSCQAGQVPALISISSNRVQPGSVAVTGLNFEPL